MIVYVLIMNCRLGHDVPLTSDVIVLPVSSCAVNRPLLAADVETAADAEGAVGAVVAPRSEPHAIKGRMPADTATTSQCEVLKVMFVAYP